MAKKPGIHLVIDGCVQEGKKVYVKGEEYTPPSAELADQLVKAGTIASIRSASAQAQMRDKASTPPDPGTETPPADSDLLNQQAE